MSVAGTQPDFFLGGEGILAPSDASVALIVVDGDRYLMQFRDQAPRIFYPGHWGLFGGAQDPGEDRMVTLRRELQEELTLQFDEAGYFTEFVIDFTVSGHGWVRRTYFELHLDREDLESLVLGEGSDMRLFAASEILLGQRVVPYDAFAIWMHATQRPKNGSARER